MDSSRRCKEARRSAIKASALYSAYVWKSQTAARRRKTPFGSRYRPRTARRRRGDLTGLAGVLVLGVTDPNSQVGDSPLPDALRGAVHLHARHENAFQGRGKAARRRRAGGRAGLGSGHRIDAEAAPQSNLHPHGYWLLRGLLAPYCGAQITRKPAWLRDSMRCFPSLRLSPAKVGESTWIASAIVGFHRIFHVRCCICDTA